MPFTAAAPYPSLGVGIGVPFVQEGKVEADGDIDPMIKGVENVSCEEKGLVD
jgi:hypothetical protein